jgi:hypothetical protein
MPIRINLLSEQQAAMDARRRDPVRRATWAAGGFLCLLLLWAGYLQLQLMRAAREITGYEARYKEVEPSYIEATNSRSRIQTAQARMYALAALATNRFLWANPLNALQFSLVDDIQAVRLKTEQTVMLTEGTKSVTNTAGVKRGRPATSRERVLFSLEARDLSSKPGDQIFRFQEALNGHPYFKTNLKRAELTGRSPVQTDSVDPSKSFVLFTLECEYPERTR